MAAGLLLPVGVLAGDTAGELVDKATLRRTGAPASVLMAWVFVSMAAVLAIACALTSAGRTVHVTTGIVLAMVAVVAVSYTGNIASYLSLSACDVSLRQPLVGMTPILAAGIGMVLAPRGESAVVVALFLAATVVVWWGTTRRALSRAERAGMYWLAVSVAAFSALPTLYARCLEATDPLMLALVRVLGVLVLTLAVQRPTLTGVPGVRRGAAVSGSLYALSTVAGMSAIESWGVARAMALALLAPVAMLTACRVVLGERPRRGEVVSSLLLAAIATTIVAAVPAA